MSDSITKQNVTIAKFAFWLIEWTNHDHAIFDDAGAGHLNEEQIYRTASVVLLMLGILFTVFRALVPAVAKRAEEIIQSAKTTRIMFSIGYILFCVFIYNLMVDTTGFQGGMFIAPVLFLGSYTSSRMRLLAVHSV